MSNKYQLMLHALPILFLIGASRCLALQPMHDKISSKLDVMLCQAAWNADRLARLRRSWLSSVTRTPSIDAHVFMPAGAQEHQDDFKVTALHDWGGTQVDYQTAMSRAIVPCVSHAPAKYYAIMDDDVIVNVPALLAWVSQLSDTADALWGREGCCGIVYGGMLLMPEHTARAIADNIEDMVEHVTREATRRNFDSYKGAPFMVDHFFSLAVQKLGGAIHETSAIHEGLDLPWPASVVAEHHIHDKDFDKFIAGLSRSGSEQISNTSSSRISQVVDHRGVSHDLQL